MTVTPLWSASTLSVTTKTKPHAAGMFGGRYSSPETPKNLLDDQS